MPPWRDLNILINYLDRLRSVTHTWLNIKDKIVLAAKPAPLQDKTFRSLAINPACTQ